MTTQSRKKVQIKETSELKKHSHLSSYGNILELGCGDGYGCGLIKRYFDPDEYTGIDLDEAMITKAHMRREETRGIRFRNADTTDLPFDEGSFHAVFNFGSMHHVPDWKKALNEVCRVMKSRAEFLCVDFDRHFFNSIIWWGKKWMIPHPYETMYSQEEFKLHLESLDMETVYHNPHFKPAFAYDYFVIISRKS